MLSHGAASAARSCSKARPSYLEISRFIRCSLASPAARTSTHPVSRQARRDLHCSQQLKDLPHDDQALPGFVHAYKKYLSFSAKTDEIHNLDDTPETISREVVLYGYLGARNNLSKALVFLPLLNQSMSHSIQVVSSLKGADERRIRSHEQIKDLSVGTPVVIKGLLKSRESTSSKDLGDIKKIRTKEVELREVQALNEFPTDIIVASNTIFPPEKRHLQIRQEKSLRDALKFRSDLSRRCRDWLGDKGFIEVETPLLFKSTPEGAREFIVPTRRKGLAYALPQSPQQFKQILMGSGISRYFQIARCFRDEDLRADRQPEFTQLDLEMSFASAEDVMQTIEDLISELWKEMLSAELESPFSRITYQQAMSKYGSDKPDLRLGMTISRIDHLIPADLTSKISSLPSPAIDIMLFRPAIDDFSPALARTFIGDFLDSLDGKSFKDNPNGGPGVFIYDSSKPLSGLQSFGFEAAEAVETLLQPQDGDILILQARSPKLSGGSTATGNLRVALHREAVKQLLLPAPTGFIPLWVTEFPLFSPSVENEPGQSGAAGLAATHHPFTSPKTAEDVDKLGTDPESVIGDHYDIVVNGVELGGGSRRIHNADMQQFIMEQVLKMSGDRMAEFSHLIEVLRAGCPPHAGIALGFDRLVAMMLDKESVRDVIAFPKSGKGEDLLVKSPGLMTKEVLKTYHIQLR